VRMRQTIGAVMVAVLLLASPLPAMCGQCQFASSKPHCQTTRIASLTPPETAPEATAGEHCQHLGQQVDQHLKQRVANSQPAPAARVALTQYCQERPCQGLLDAAAKTNRGSFARLPHTIRSLVSTVGSGDHELVAINPLQSPFEGPPRIPLSNQSLPVSLRI
jgi:hypothetical protein